MHKLTFRPGETFFHKLYPLTKLIWLILGSVICFLLTNGLLLLIIVLISLSVLLSINSTILKVRGFRFTLLTAFALLLLYLVFDKTGMPLNSPKNEILRITTGGIAIGLLISGRFLSIIFLSYIFILTTNPSLIAYTLMNIGLPYRYGFMLVTALRLAPLMEEEGKTIYWSQLVRGVRYDHANPRKIILLVQQLLTPLLISAIRRTDHLVFSMEGHGFGQYNKRTFLSRVSPTKLDLMSSLFLVIFYSSLLYLNFRL